MRILFICFACISLLSCRSGNVLFYSYKRHYYEENTLYKEPNFEMEQSICFNLPNVSDEEYCYELHIKIVDTTVAKQKKVLDLAVDTMIVRSSFNIFSIWLWDLEGSIVSGHIKILKWRPNSIRLKENVLVIDPERKEKKRFKGRRTFRLKQLEE